MPNLLQTGAAFLAAKLKEFAATEIYYHRAGAGVVRLQVQTGQTSLHQDDGFGGTRLVVIDRDYFIPAADLHWGAGLVEPMAGDWITETTGAYTRTYEVMPQFGEPVWRWADGFYGVYRVHTKLVKTEGVRT